MILFDIDETLFDNSGAEIKASKRFYQKTKGLDHFEDLDDFVGQWRVTTETYLQMFIDRRLSFQEQRRRRLRDIFRQPFSDEEADALFKKYLLYYEESWELFPDVRPCLDRLALLGLGIITNGNSCQQRQKLRELGIIDYFDVIIISEDVGVSKPDPQIFIQACKAANQTPSNCIYVGDKLETDALAASEAGLMGTWLNRKRQKSTHDNIQVIYSLNELHGDKSIIIPI